MFPLSPMMYVYAGVGALVIALGVGVKVQTARLDSCKATAAAFQAITKAEGQAAEKARQKDILDRQAISTKQEADNAKRIASLDLRYRAALATARLSGANSGSGQAQSLSSAATSISCPDRSGDVAGRLAELETGILGLLERGDKASERTITCKAWIDEQVSKSP